MQDNTQQQPDAANQSAVTGTQKRALSVEIIGEIILLVAVGAFFAYLFVQSLSWTLGARLTPQIAIAIGTPFWILRVIYVVRTLLWTLKTETVSRGQIMDVGFRVGDDPRSELRRFIKIVVAIGVLYVGIWLVGFQIMVPLWVFTYMFWFGNSRFIWAALMASIFLGLIIGVYDYLLNSPWPEPVLFRLFS